MTKGQHCLFYAASLDGSLDIYAAHYDRDLGNGRARLFVRLDDGSEMPMEGDHCDPTQRTAGCWSELP
jgi:hypothetical protein